MDRWTTLLAALCLAGAVETRADTIVLDGSTGADYDAVGDGWMFAGNPNTPPNGVGDAGNNTLAVGLIAGTLELRAMAEFPLGLFASLEPADIVSATLTVTIDDVIGTFGPGSTFDGTASESIFVQAYPADGTVTLADFFPDGRVDVDEITPGVVTDASLAITGALRFDLDVTNLMKTAVMNDFAAFGVIMATDDSPTATSLDDMGVTGAALPFITVVINGSLPTTTTTTGPTTTAVPTTTTTTLPPGCGIAGTVEGIRCGVDRFAGEIAGAPALDAVRAKLTKNLNAIRTLLGKVQAASDSRNAKKAKSAARKLGGKYRALGRPLRSLRARKTIPGEVREPLLADIEQMRQAAKALKQSL